MRRAFEGRRTGAADERRKNKRTSRHNDTPAQARVKGAVKYFHTGQADFLRDFIDMNQKQNNGACMLTPSNFAEAVTIAIHRDGRRRIDIAAEIGCNAASLSHYTNGHSVPTDFRIIEAMERVFKVEPGTLKTLAAIENPKARSEP